MPYANSSGDMWSGVGAAQGWLWPLGNDAPQSVGAGAAGGWWSDQIFIGSSPRGQVWSPSMSGPSAPWPSSIGADDFPANVIVAGRANWGASNGQHSIGDVPPGYEGWQWWAIGNDGTRVMVLNGQYRVWWPNGSNEQFGSPGTISMGDGCIVQVAPNGDLWQKLQDGAIVIPQQRPGLKYFATTVRATDGASWLLYSSAELGKFICHRGDDASQGYILDDLTVLGPVGPCGVTLADGRTVLGWAVGPAQQGPDMRRRIVTLGVGMVPFVAPLPEPPDPEPPDPEPEPPQPEPEPEPMPGRPEPKDRDVLEELSTAAYLAHVGGMSVTDARQGVRQVADRIASHPGLYWDAYDLAMGAPTRDGAPSVTIEAGKLDKLAKDCEVINRECLQR